MKNLKTIVRFWNWLLMSLLLSVPVFAQGYGGALTFQGLDQHLMHSAAGRAMGGVSVGVRQDIGVMFQNPAMLQSLTGIQLSLGGQSSTQDLEQEQNYAPVRYYPNFSLLLEGLSSQIPEPDTTIPGFTAQDSVQRQFDNIGPNWSHSADQRKPLQASLAVPLSLGNVKVVAGVGAVRYASLQHYYQNNNVLSPGILSQRPLPTLRPTDDNPLEVEWRQSIRSRKGSIQGYGFALAGSIQKYNLAFGFSGLILDGSSDDYEQEIGRGNLTFFSNAFRLDSVNSRIIKTGTSDYSGSEFTLSSLISGRYVSLGVSVKLPAAITRSYTMQVSTDTTGTPALSTVSGEDEMKLPWRGTVGISLAPRENLTVGLEYVYRPYDSAKYVDPDGVETTPWLGASLFRVGAEYRIASWLALRGGMRGDAEIFEPEGNQIAGDPVSYTVYSAGVGVGLSGFQLNVGYEYAKIKYQDTWASAISKNSDQRQVIMTQLSYQLPW